MKYIQPSNFMGLTPTSKGRFRRLILAISSIVLVAGIVQIDGWEDGGDFLTARQPEPPSAPVQDQAGMLSAQQLEARYGIRITLVAVTAAGGIVDFRYRVTEPDKAMPLLHASIDKPILITLDNGLTLYPTAMGMKHHRSMKSNAAPFAFYPNVRGAVKPGTPVSVVFGDMQVGPIIAQ